MQIILPSYTLDSDRVAHAARIAAALLTQSALWAVAPDCEIDVPRSNLTAGAEILLQDLADLAGDAHSNMANLVSAGVVLRPRDDLYRIADVAAAPSAAVKFTATQAFTNVFRADGRSVCAQGMAAVGQRVFPSDVVDGFSGLLIMETRGLVVRS